MKLRIRTNEHKFMIPFPNGLLLNGAVSKVASKAVTKHTDLQITSEQLRSLFSEIKNAKKVLKGTPLIYVKSANGEEVTITL